MRFLMFLPLLALMACQSETSPAGQGASALPDCKVIYVVDGDTVHLDCGSGRIKARLLGFDTPEVSKPKCRAEAETGARATAALSSIVHDGPITALRFDGTDRYGRALVALEIGGRDVAQTMIAAGLALPYSGHQHPDWCAILG